MVRLSASINPCPEDKAVEYTKELQNFGVDYVHLDVMRSNFVANDVLHINTIYEIGDNTLLPLDCHLMVNEPLEILEEYVKLKPTYITVHYEAFANKEDIYKAIKLIKKHHILVGLSIKPNTFVDEIKEFLSHIDMVLIMGVEPGLSGQKMVSNTIPKIKQLRNIICEYEYDVKIEVDGGINEDNMKDVYNAGADILVIGSKLYDSKDKKRFIQKVHSL